MGNGTLAIGPKLPRPSSTLPLPSALQRSKSGSFLGSCRRTGDLVGTAALGPRLCENSDARRARRNILEKLRVMRTDRAADIRLDAMLKNCIFNISPMYEFSHSLDP
jgi:hypothetical protein